MILRADRSAVGRYDGFADRKAKSNTALGIRTFPFCGVKHLKDVGQILSRNAASPVSNRKNNRLLLRSSGYGHGNLFFRLRVLDCVVQQICQHLTDQSGIHGNHQDLIGDAGSILSTFESATEKELQPSNKAALDEVEQKIIDLQEKVLALHRQKRAQSVNDAYYNAQVNDYSQQLAALEDQQQALQTADARYATVRMWLSDFQQHMQEGDATDDRDGKMMKSLVESIIIWPDRMEIHFRCGVNIEQKYVK